MIRLLLGCLAVLALSTAPAAAQSPPAKAKPQRAGLWHDLIVQKWTGDLDGMIERRLIRVLTVYSKTLYFVDKYLERMEARKQLLPPK